jgi:hypothetical protein
MLTWTLGDADMREWEILMNILEEYRLNGEDDQFVWILDQSGNYTTRSMYRRIIFRGVLYKKNDKVVEKYITK